MKLLKRTANEFVIALSETELELLIAGLRETLESLEDWEFETRVGVPRSEMVIFLDEVLAIAKP